MEYRLIPIEQASQLPQPGTAYETRMFDMKLRQMAGSPYDKAKDVAAFANATGGVILIGALEEQATGHLLRYEPMPEEGAKTLREDYESAVRARCSPIPIIDTRIIQKDAGFVVAVNVWPFPGQVVGVKIRSDGNDGRQVDAWTYHMRSGTHTITLEPEQTTMLMSPKNRSTAIALSRIPMRVGVHINLSYQAVASVTSMSKVERTVHASGELHGYEILENRVHLRVEHPTTSQKVDIFIPMDAVESVWQGKDNNEWFMPLAGTIVFPREKAPFYSYHIDSY